MLLVELQVDRLDAYVVRRRQFVVDRAVTTVAVKDVVVPFLKKNRVKNPSDISQHLFLEMIVMEYFFVWSSRVLKDFFLSYLKLKKYDIRVDG